jgi:flagellar biosynthesis protein FlhA
VPSGEAERIDGVPTKEPAFGLPALWIGDREVERAQTAGYMVVDPATVIATHLTELLKAHAWELLTRSEVQGMLDTLSRNYPKLLDELIPAQMTLGGVQRVLQNLLKERVPINDLVTVLETLLDHAPSTKDLEILTEHVRQSLSRYITRQYLSGDGSLYVMTLDPRFELTVSQALESGGSLSPDFMAKLIRALEKAIREDRFKGTQPIILCSPQVRRFLRKMTERFIPSLVVLSSAELAPTAKLNTTGVVKYED